MDLLGRSEGIWWRMAGVLRLVTQKLISAFHLEGRPKEEERGGFAGRAVIEDTPMYPLRKSSPVTLKRGITQK